VGNADHGLVDGAGADVIAHYDMSNILRPTTYDFFNWLVHVKLLGATEITFRVEPMRQSKWPIAESLKRFRNYIFPGPALAGLPARVANEGDGKIGSIQLHVLLDDLKKLGKELPRLKSVLPPDGFSARYTVTIRETFHNPHKNSDRDMWLKFADEIGAVVIEDTAREPMELFTRVGLYAGARMNFGVVNGPLALLYYTPYPFAISCDPVATAKSFGGHNIKPGDQVPWFLPNQKLIWEKPNLEGLLREFELIRDRSVAIPA
jgi:hypothetical protein